MVGYRAARADNPEPTNVTHAFVKAAAGLNNRAENTHQPIRERRMPQRDFLRSGCGFREPFFDLKGTQAFLSIFGSIRQHFQNLPHAF